MIMISILAMTGLITIATGSPMSYATYRRRDLPVDERPELLVLYGQSGLENSDSSPRSVYDIEREYGNEISLQDISDVPKSVLSRIARDKKNGLGRNSLSIVNPIDVLRQRVLLQLARKKAMQQQRQIDANRRMLDSVGKRSVHELDSGYPRTILPSQSVENRVYTTDRQNEARNDEHEPQQAYTQRNPMERTREWYNVDETVIRGSGDDDTRKVLSNYHHDRM